MKTKYLKNIALVACLGAIPAITYAQREVATQNFANTTDGSPVAIQKYENITGSPYLTDDWSTGLVKLADGRTFKDVNIRYDQVADELQFKKEGKELVFINPVFEFKINTDSKQAEKNSFYFKKGFKPDEKTFYQVLADGKTSLVKKNKKIIVDKTPYNSATAVKVFEPQIRYFIYKNDEFIPVKSNKKSILSVLNDKQDQLSTYVNEQKINFSNDNDLSKLFTYYNSL